MKLFSNSSNSLGFLVTLSGEINTGLNDLKDRAASVLQAEK